MASFQRYDKAAIFLHWAIAALILAAFVLGLTVDAFPESWDGAVVNTHALIGLAIIALSLVRLAWRLGHRPPALPPGIGPFQRRVTAMVHSLLYVLMVAVPLIGVPTLLYRGRGLDFGLFQIASPFERTPELARPLTEVHELASFVLIGLAVGHALAALYHHVVRGDGILLRMLPR
jgi:cytochrome b561